MKQFFKSSKLITTLVLLLLAFLCVLNVSYSYFSSTSNTNGNIAFSDLNVRFVYAKYTAGGSQGVYESKNENVLYLTPSTGVIKRDTPFTLSLESGGDPLYMIGIQNRTGSCQTYVRFWIDAYIVTDQGVDTSVNYGKYFKLSGSYASTVLRATPSICSVSDSTCYFIRTAVEAGDGRSVSLGNQLTLTDYTANDVVPARILGERIRITLGFEAVQVANKAYLTVFGDEEDSKGYCKFWS